jgi:hypothetical protein
MKLVSTNTNLIFVRNSSSLTSLGLFLMHHEQSLESETQEDLGGDKEGRENEAEGF